MARQMAAKSGLRDEHFKGFAVIPEWTKRTAKDATIRKEVQKSIDILLEHQQNYDQAELLRNERTELIERMCVLYSKVLKTPIVPDEVAHLVRDVSLAKIPEIIMAECNKRMEVEQRAAAPEVQAVPTSAPGGGDWICPSNCAKMPEYGFNCPELAPGEQCPLGIPVNAVPAAPPTPIQYGPPIEQAGPPVTLQGPPIIPGCGPAMRYNVTFKIYDVSEVTINDIIGFLGKNGVGYLITARDEKGVI